MANDEQIRIAIAAVYKGQAAINQAVADLKRVDAASAATNQANTKTSGILSSAGAAWSKLATGLGVASVAFYAVARAAGAAWGMLKEGAALQTTQLRFDKLSASIGSTADALLGKLRDATMGMTADAELMASASQIISLRLAENEDQVVRLATVAGRLNWDMQQVILTFSNLSTMRLDALGLSVDEVREKQKELEAQGYSTAAAFKEAVIQAGESRLDVAGLSDAEKAIRQAEAAVSNYTASAKLQIVTILEQAGAFEALGNSAEKLSGFVTFTQEIERLRDAGEITGAQYNELNAIIRRGGEDMARAALGHMQMVKTLSDTGDATGDNVGAWQTWATSVAITLANTETNTEIVATNIIRDLSAIRAELLAASQDAEKIASAGYMRAGRARQSAIAGMSSGYGGLPYASPDRLQAGYLAKANMDYDRAADSARGYGGAVGYAITQEEALAAAHARLAAAFMAEATAKPEDGLIGADGLVNVNAMTDALMQQAQAAGAGAVEMAMLGIATGKFSKEQAAAALKAAVLQEQIRKIAEGVASGNIKYDAAVGYLEEFRKKLDASGGGAEGATANVEELVGMAKELTGGPYQADINANTTQAQADLQAVLDMIHGISGVHQATIIVDDQTTGGGGNEGPFAAGGYWTGRRPALVGENGPELLVPMGQGGYIVPNNQLTDYQGGSTLNISITNVVEGRVIGRSQLDDITTDSLMHALRAGGVV